MKHLIFAGALLALAGCGAFSDPPEETESVGMFADDLPEVFVAGATYPLRVVGRSETGFLFVEVFLFAGPVIQPGGGTLLGDTLAVATVPLSPSAFTVDAVAEVTVPPGAVDAPTDGWVFFRYASTGCTDDCASANGLGVRITP